MLCEHLSLHDLERALEPHMKQPAWPGLEPENRKRVRRLAKALGEWDRWTARFDSRSPIAILPRSLFREYARTGQRPGYEKAYGDFQKRTRDAAMTLWLDHPAANLDLLQDLLWYWCEATSWILPAHEYKPGELDRTLELVSTGAGVLLSEILYLVGHRLEPEVSERLGREIDARILDPTHDFRMPHWWATCDMNWNHVCNANLIQTALYRIPQPDQLAKFILPLLQRLDYALEGFAADGGCREGPGYWEYGFGHYAQAAAAMHRRTGGTIDLMADPRVAAICRYPLATYLAPPLRACFADGGDGYLGAQTALLINRFHAAPELLALTRPRRDGRVDARTWRELALYDGRPRPRKPTLPDAVLPALGQARMTVGNGARRVTVAALAGRNDVPHNHNDIGSFILFKHGRPALVDPGAPIYTKDTFGPKRYEILHCRSLGHSVPSVNGREQRAGSQYVGTLATQNLATEGRATRGEKTLRIDLSKAYPDATLRTLIRTLTLRRDGSLRLLEEYAFSRKPVSVEEGFVTFDPVTIEKGGGAARIGRGDQTVRLAADGAPGRFRVEDRTESLETDPRRRLLRRIVFTPDRLAREMTFSFLIR